MGNEVSAEQEAPAAPDPPPLTGTVPVCLLWPHGGKTAYICGSFTQWQKMPMQWRQAGASGEWFKVVDLTPGTHQYKFIIDGQWRHDHTAPTVLDNLGNVNNCTHVQLPAAEAATSAGESGGAGAGKAAEQANGGRAGRREPPEAEPEEDLGNDPRGRASGAASRTSLQSGVSGCSSNGLGAWPSDPYLSTARPRPESYGQVVPAREELLVHHTASLLLPPQLRLLLPQHHGDSTTMPLAVQMNHLFCNLRDDVSILAVAHRYKDRSVTQLLYKPGMDTIRARSHAAAAASAGAAGAGATAGMAPVRRASEIRNISRDVQLRSVRVPGSQRDRDENGLEFTVYLVDSVLVVHGVQTTLRSDRRYTHFQLLHQLLLKEFATLIPQALPPKRAFGNLQSQFVEERRIALERYLQLCLSTPEVALSSTFCNFLEADVPGRDFSKLDDAQGVMGAACTKQGYLLKRGRRLASWKRRCFCLCASELFYYYTAEMSNPFQPLGVISLKPEPLDEPEPPSPPPGGVAPDMRGATVSAVADIGLPHLFGLTVHTKQRVWDLAADTAADRDEWIRVLCQAGAQLSTSGAEEPPALPRSAWAWAEMSKAVEEAASKGNGSEGGGGQGGGGEGGEGEGGEGGEAGSASDEAVATLNGVLWKRASKVHIAQAAVEESGLARDWVTRHFRLLPSDGTLAYFQKEGDEASMVRGILPLACYDGVSEPPAGADGSAGSTPDGLHAFQLTASDGSPERAFVLAATSADEKLQWMERLRALFAAAAVARATAAAAAAAAAAVEDLTAPQE